MGTAVTLITRVSAAEEQAHTCDKRIYQHLQLRSVRHVQATTYRARTEAVGDSD